MGLRLNLGCGDRLLDGYLNVDHFPYRNGEEDNFLCYDLEALPWPWESSSIVEVRAHDVLEHLSSIIPIMNEIWRVLTPNGLLDIFIPTTDGRGAWQDPTHKTWWNRNTFFYFTVGIPERERFMYSYGICAGFRVVSEEFSEYPNQVSKLRIRLQAIKN